MTVTPNNINGGMMKFKLNILRTSTILALTAFATPTFSENLSCLSPKITSWQPYVGASAGYSRLSAKNNWEEENSGIITPGKNNFNGKGFLGLLHAGVRKSISSTINFGAEFYGFLESHKASVNTDGRLEALKRKNGGGLKFKAGYLFDTHSSFYLHGGVEKAQFKYTVSLEDASVTRNKYLWGAPFGIGIEACLSPRWIARLEYTHVTYQKWDTGVQRLSGYTSKAKISPSQDSILLGVSYTF